MSNDITLRRDHQSAVGPDGGMLLLTGNANEKRQWDADQKTEELQKQIYNLQNHSYYLDRQLKRLLTINPEMQDLLDQKENEAKLSDGQLNEQTQIAQLVNRSTLIQSYEQIM